MHNQNWFTAYKNERDKTYFLLIKNQYSSNFPLRIILLNPKVKFGEEWEMWIFANWMPGAKRYRSFWDLVKGKFEEMLNLEKL